jgi:hypothetical protein
MSGGALSDIPVGSIYHFLITLLSQISLKAAWFYPSNILYEL